MRIKITGGTLDRRNGKWYLVIYRYNSETHERLPNQWVSTDLPEKNNKRNAQRMLDDYLSEHRGTAILGDGKSFADFYREWLRIEKMQVKENTYTTYVWTAEKYIIPYFTKHPVSLEKMKTSDIDLYYSYLLEECDLSASTVRKHHANIRKALQYAVDTELIPKNPAAKATLPKKQKFIASCYSIEQLNKLLDASKGTELEDVVHIAVNYGMRRSEILGLRWSSVHLEDGYITIEGTAVPNAGQVLYSDETKNRSSNRSLPLTEQEIAFFRGIKAKQANNAAVFGDCYTHSDYVCTHTDGRPIRPDYVTHAFKRIISKAGLPDVRFHDLRHSFATVYINHGGDLKHLQEWLGHSKIDTTGDIYSHLNYRSKQEMAQQMIGLLSADRSETTDADTADTPAAG
ncbi:MAG: site-specific integrase, partial [Oscillospiraceae bacterium]|nr:site-specific integrase [Oscillospiraceae bacterium]